MQVRPRSYLPGRVAGNTKTLKSSSMSSQILAGVLTSKAGGAANGYGSEVGSSRSQLKQRTVVP